MTGLIASAVLGSVGAGMLFAVQVLAMTLALYVITNIAIILLPMICGCCGVACLASGTLLGLAFMNR